MPRRYSLNRITLLLLVSAVMCVLTIAKLAYLQIYKHSYYLTIAQKEHLGYTELPARRGEILIQDASSSETFKLATNITLDQVYADPTLIKNEQIVVDALTPLLFDLQEERLFDQERVLENLNSAKTPGKKEKIKLLNDEELLVDYKKRMFDKISQETRPQILLQEHLEKELQDVIKQKNLPGLLIKETNLYALTQEITNRDKVAKFLSPLLDIEVPHLNNILQGKNRYVILKKKISPEISGKIKSLKTKDPEKNFFGIGLKEKYYRFYPENELAAQTLGFVDQQQTGRYGIESAFNVKLTGKAGMFSSQKDVYGKQITVGDSVIKPAIDGDNVYLTLDRSVQIMVEKKLKKYVTDSRADAGQAIIMDPKTGKIISMVHYPTFDPNNYGDAFALKKITFTPEEVNNLIPVTQPSANDLQQYILYLDKNTGQKVQVFKKEKENSPPSYYVYKNRVGPQVFRNSAISDIYEPGSVFKVITMAAGLNDGTITPNTSYYETGPINVDCDEQGVCDFTIHNAQDKYRGYQNMINILENSSNVGISFVARKLGRTLLSDYMDNFGFGERTDIEFEEEHPGKIEFFENWSESELYTHAFGQGIAVTPLQMITAVAAIANDGLLMQPYIVDQIERENKKTIKTEPKIIHSVITKETAATLTSMMVSAVENGVAKQAQVKKHFVAGKTGTSQTYKNGKVLTGVGTTITSFVGFGPVDSPKFIVLLKIDHPRTEEWGSTVVTPLFSEIAEFLFNYYNIPPDKP